MNRIIILMLFAILGFSNVANAQMQPKTEDDTISVSFQGFRITLKDLDHVNQTRLSYNWYLGAQVGLANSFNSYYSRSNFIQRANPAVALTISKEITPVSEIRTRLMYQRNTGNWFDETDPTAPDGRYHWNTGALYFEYMPNLTSIIGGYRENAGLTIKGILGAGFESTFGYDDKIDGKDIPFSDRHTLFANGLIGLEAGLNVSMRINDMMRFYVEGTFHFLDDSYDKNTTLPSNKWDRHVNIMAGVTFSLNKKPEQRQFTNVRKDDPTLYQLANDIDDLDNEIDSIVRAPKTFVYDTIEVKKNIIYTLIAFDEKSTVVDRLQQANVFTAARILGAHPKSHIFVTNSSAVDDELFRNRAKEIIKVLRERYNVEEKQVSYIADEKKALNKTTKDDTYILFIIND